MTKRILIIDDEELILKSLTKLLEKNGFVVTIAKKGQEAIVAADKENFDLIVSDVRMPGINGIEAVRAVYKTIQSRNAEVPPVIFITGYADQDIEAEAKSLNPVDYIFKPFDIFTLVNRINEVVS